MQMHVTVIYMKTGVVYLSTAQMLPLK